MVISTKALAEQVHKTVGSTYHKYDTHSKVAFSIIGYHKILNDMIQQNPNAHILDFGCGIGMSQLVWEHCLAPSPSQSLHVSDWCISWVKGEKDVFDEFRDTLGIDWLRTTSIIPNRKLNRYEEELGENWKDTVGKGDVFKFIDEPPVKFNTVIAMRFPPLIHCQITPQKFKERIQPYCTEDFKLHVVYITKDAYMSASDSIEPDWDTMIHHDHSYDYQYTFPTGYQVSVW